MSKIERRAQISRADYFAHYVNPQKPLVFTDLFSGQPLDRLRTPELFRERFGDMPIMVYEHYHDTITRAAFALLGGGDKLKEVRPHEMLTTISKYMDEIARNPKYQFLCSESPKHLWPDEFRAALKFPSYCHDRSGELAGLITELWLGPPGYITHMHYDADARDILNHQVFGRRRFILAPPTSSTRIGSILNYGIFSPTRLSESERRKWVESIDGYEVELAPGETLLIPGLWWHHTDYLDTSFSIAIRHNSNAYKEAFYANVQPNYKTQRIVNEYRDEQAISSQWRAVFERFEGVFSVQPDAAKQAKMRSLVNEVYEEMFGNDATTPFLSPVVNWAAETLEAQLAQANNLQSLRFKGGDAKVETREA
ncbi:cupin-like domain-containing protein [Bradyrhizobium sp. SZCCHNR2035]|uniref:cupin-like domain-containing protein n=1 Tax=Bradyrhizobium sp. SZCCHNR2035 TaxID=3057386 RepID=UPI002916494D|nr:cupin-like domain-containing protein [Bradyrhizobium sp. SZCCHNR2035]